MCVTAGFSAAVLLAVAGVCPSAREKDKSSRSANGSAGARGSVPVNGSGCRAPLCAPICFGMECSYVRITRTEGSHSRVWFISRRELIQTTSTNRLDFVLLTAQKQLHKSIGWSLVCDEASAYRVPIGCSILITSASCSVFTFYV